MLALWLSLKIDVRSLSRGVKASAREADESERDPNLELAGGDFVGRAERRLAEMQHAVHVEHVARRIGGELLDIARLEEMPDFLLDPFPLRMQHAVAMLVTELVAEQALLAEIHVVCQMGHVQQRELGWIAL